MASPAPAAAAILARFGIRADAFIDSGAQSEVFALGDDRVLRIFREPADLATLERLRRFLSEIDGRVAMATPAILMIDPDGRFTVERRLPGRSMLRRLPALSAARRQVAIVNFVARASAFASVTMADRPYGHILAAHPIHADTWTGFLRLSLDRAISHNRAAIAGAAGEVAALRSRALALLAEVPDRPPKALVHGDWFPGNVLMDDRLAVSSVVDFSAYTMVGDPHYDALTAPIFLEMVDASADDVTFAHAQVKARHNTAAVPFYRVHAAFWMADPALAAPPYPGLYPWAVAELRRLATSMR